MKWKNYKRWLVFASGFATFLGATADAAELKRGQFYIAPLPSKENGNTLTVLQDYDNHKAIYKPDVRDSRLLSRSGNDFKVFLQFYRKSPVTTFPSRQRGRRKSHAQTTYCRRYPSANEN